MDLATLLGAAAGLVLVLLAIVRNGSLLSFIDPVALAITLGGTLAATLIHYPFHRVKAALAALRTVLRPGANASADLVRTMVEYAAQARLEGLLVLEGEAERAEDPFLRKGLQLVVDGVDPVDVRAILENELTSMEQRHKQVAGVFDTMAQLAPAFGLVGTLISLVQVMQRMDDPGSMGAAMAVALLATFYGVLLANLLFQPVAGKLKVRSREEVQRRELVLEGLLALQAGDTPGLLEEKLNSFLAPSGRAPLHRVHRDGED